MDLIANRLEELGFALPPPAKPGGNYLPYLIVDKTLYLAGVISIADGQIIGGVAGGGKSVEEGYSAARYCTLLQLANMKEALGSLDRVARIISLNGYVNAVPGFTESPQVINGASDLLVQLFGEKGLHVRAAIGVPALPRGALVEVQMIVAIEN
jgi:enamine deaminase RidA (YjgF/YER057c/UK114 family)